MHAPPAFPHTPPLPSQTRYLRQHGAPGFHRTPGFWGLTGETTRVHARVSDLRSPTKWAAAIPPPSRFQTRGLGGMRSEPAAATPRGPRAGPALAHRGSKAPSRPRPRNGNAARPPPAPARPRRGKDGGREGAGPSPPRPQVGEGGTLRETPEPDGGAESRPPVETRGCRGHGPPASTPAPPSLPGAGRGGSGHRTGPSDSRCALWLPFTGEGDAALRAPSLVNPNWGSWQVSRDRTQTSRPFHVNIQIEGGGRCPSIPPPCGAEEAPRRWKRGRQSPRPVIRSRTLPRGGEAAQSFHLDRLGRGWGAAGAGHGLTFPEGTRGASHPTPQAPDRSGEPHPHCGPPAHPGPPPPPSSAGHGAGTAVGPRGRGCEAQACPARRGLGRDTHLPRPGRPLPALAAAAAEEEEAGAEDETEGEDGGAAGDVRRPPPPGLRALAAADGCCCCWGFSDMVRGPYTGPHAGRGQPGAGRAEETPERGGDARAPNGEARVGAAGGAPGPATGRRSTTKGRGGPPKPRSCREPGRDAPPPLPLLPKQSEAEGGERSPEGGGPGPGPGGGGAAEGYGSAAALPPPRRSGRGSECRPGPLAAAKRRGSMAAAGPRGPAAAERIGGRGRRGVRWRCRVGAEAQDGDSLPEVGRVGRKQNVTRPQGREGHVRSGRRAGPRSRGSGEGLAAHPARIRPPRGGSALWRGRVCLRLQGRPSTGDGREAFPPRPPIFLQRPQTARLPEMAPT